MTVHSLNKIAASDHPIRPEHLSTNTHKVLDRLHQAGFDAFVVGGCIRDLLLGQQPKDFDVVTNATPEQIKSLFKNCRLIGRRFRLAHIVFGRDIIEVATYRGPHDDQPADKVTTKQSVDGQLMRDNVFGTIEQDAQRRDFSINALYYSPHDGCIYDFTNSMQAFRNKEITLLGDVETRFREDPVRILRAIRFQAKLGLPIAPATVAGIEQFAHLLENIPPARLWDEILKLLFTGQGLRTFKLLYKYHIFQRLFPVLADYLHDEASKEFALTVQTIKNTDERINNDLRVTPAFMYAAFLWYPIEQYQAKIVMETSMAPHDAFHLACNEILHRQQQRIMIPKRFSIVIKEIWQFQHRLTRRKGRRAYQLLEQGRFRAAYDFLLLRAEIEGGALVELAQWWTEFQRVSSAQRKLMIDALPAGGEPKKRRRKPKSKSHGKS